MRLRSCTHVAILGLLGACAADEPGDEVYWGETGKGDDPAVESMLDEVFDEEDPLACGNASTASPDELPGAGSKTDSAVEWQVHETDHFVIRYQTEGDNRVLAAFLDLGPRDGIPDFVNHVAAGAEEGYATYVDDWGFPPDPDKTRIWIKEADGYFGYVTDGQIVMDNDSFAFAISRHFLRATTAHEYFHIVQLNLAQTWTGQDRWFTESSAVWAEQQATGLWDGLVGGFVRDLLLADRLRFNLDKSLTEVELMNGPYSSFVYPQYLAERFAGPETIREIFRTMGDGQGAMTAIASVVADEGSDFDAEFREHSLWNYLVGSRDDGSHYSDGRSFFHRVASSKVEASHRQPPSEWQESESAPARYAASYVEIDVPRDAGSLAIEIEADANLSWGASLLVRTDDSWESLHPEPASGESLAIELDDLEDADRVVVAVQQLGSLNTAPLAFRYRARAD